MIILAFIVILCIIRKENRASQNTSWALLLPTITLFIISSRPLSTWINSGSVGSDLGDLGGNSTEAVIYLSLYALSVFALRNRINRVKHILLRSSFVLLIYAFFLLSAAWSEFPFVTIKRCVRDLGLLLMALVVLTDDDPIQAIRTVFIRCSFFFFVLSAMLIKWFPHLGRMQSQNGDNMFIGVASHRNTLGAGVLILSVMLFLDLALIYKNSPSQHRSFQIRVRSIMIVLGLWLLFTSQSKTSLFCLILTAIVFVMTGPLSRMHQPRKIVLGLAACFFVVFLLGQQFKVKEQISHALGRNSTLTGRTEIWTAVLGQPFNRILGCGYNSFWNSQFGINALENTGLSVLNVKSTHNGYLEMFVDGGCVGLSLFFLMLFKGLNSSIQKLTQDRLVGGIFFSLFIASLFYNYSESTFFRPSCIWFAQLLVLLDWPIKWD